MSDLNGEDAFTLVLDRLIDAQNSYHSEREKRGDADGELREFKRKHIEVAGNLEVANGRIELLIKKAKKLYEAADSVADAAPGSLPERMTALRTQLALCRDDFSTIPF